MDVNNRFHQSKEHELLSDVADNFVGDDLEDIEVDGLGEGSALADDDNVTFLDGEGGGAVDGDVPVPLLVPVVLGHIVEVVAPDHDGPLHLGGDADALEDLASDGNVAGEGALLVDVFALNSFLGGLESQSNILEVSHS